MVDTLAYPTIIYAPDICTVEVVDFGSLRGKHTNGSEGNIGETNALSLQTAFDGLDGVLSRQDVKNRRAIADWRTER